jgi:hypothetical protein
MSSEKDFIKKHKPLTRKDMEEKFKEMAKSKEQYSQDVAELENNLKDFNAITDPLVDPATNKPLCWVRRPSQAEWETMIPKELFEYRNQPESIPPDVINKYNDMTFDLMSKVIVKPTHDAAWWKQNSNTVFIRLFQMHLQMVFNELGMNAENF